MSYLTAGGVGGGGSTTVVTDQIASWLQGYDNARVALSDAGVSSGTTEAADPTLSQAALAIDTARLFDEAAALAVPRRALVPLTTVVAGEPQLVWDADNSLVMTLVPV